LDHKMIISKHYPFQKVSDRFFLEFEKKMNVKIIQKPRYLIICVQH